MSDHDDDRPRDQQVVATKVARLGRPKRPGPPPDPGAAFVDVDLDARQKAIGRRRRYAGPTRERESGAAAGLVEPPEETVEETGVRDLGGAAGPGADDDDDT